MNDEVLCVLMKLFGAILVLCLVTACSPGPAMEDPYSSHCADGQHGVGESCEEPRACETNADCDHLIVGTLPPRSGVCESGVCVAYCGSGVLRKCE